MGDICLKVMTAAKFLRNFDILRMESDLQANLGVFHETLKGFVVVFFAGAAEYQRCRPESNIRLIVTYPY